MTSARGAEIKDSDRGIHNVCRTSRMILFGRQRGIGNAWGGFEFSIGIATGEPGQGANHIHSDGDGTIIYFNLWNTEIIAIMHFIIKH